MFLPDWKAGGELVHLGVDPVLGSRIRDTALN